MAARWLENEEDDNKILWLYMLSQNSEQNYCREYEEYISSDDKNMKKFNIVAKIDEKSISRMIKIWGNYPVRRKKEEFISLGLIKIWRNE